MAWLDPAGGRSNWEKLSAYEFLGDGSPENMIPASRGATYRRRDGGASTCFYVKEQDNIAGDAKRGWVAK